MFTILEWIFGFYVVMAVIGALERCGRSNAVTAQSIDQHWLALKKRFPEAAAAFEALAQKQLDAEAEARRRGG